MSTAHLTQASKPGGEKTVFDNRAGLYGKKVFRQLLQQEDAARPIEAESLRKDDAWALAILRAVLKLSSGTELQKYNREERDAAPARRKDSGLSVRQIERLTGINRGVIRKAKSCQ